MERESLRKDHEHNGFRVFLAGKSLEKIMENQGLQFSPESQDNLRKFNSVLVDHSVVAYVNHTSKLDAAIGVSLVLSLPNTKRVIVLAGMRHYDLKRDPLSAMFFRSLRIFNVHAMPVVQVDDKTNYGRRQQEMLDGLKEETTKLIELPGSIYGITPEGTRSLNGTLQRAKRGIGYLAEYSRETYYLPAAIIYKNQTQPPLRSPEVIIGQPLQLKDIVPDNIALPKDPRERAQMLADLHMGRLAKLMPENLRGAYRD
jgi:1-acyl-sn-glycerol-3-phosphate acyltransferase